MGNQDWPQDSKFTGQPSLEEGQRGRPFSCIVISCGNKASITNSKKSKKNARPSLGIILCDLVVISSYATWRAWTMKRTEVVSGFQKLVRWLTRYRSSFGIPNNEGYISSFNGLDPIAPWSLQHYILTRNPIFGRHHQRYEIAFPLAAISKGEGSSTVPRCFKEEGGKRSLPPKSRLPLGQPPFTSPSSPL
jgi:hypothetical protein